MPTIPSRAPDVHRPGFGLRFRSGEVLWFYADPGRATRLQDNPYLVVHTKPDGTRSLLGHMNNPLFLAEAHEEAHRSTDAHMLEMLEGLPALIERASVALSDLESGALSLDEATERFGPTDSLQYEVWTAIM